MFMKTYITFALGALLLIAGCSGNGGNPVEMTDGSDHPVATDTQQATRMLWGIWELHYNIDEMSVNAIPAREAAAHFNITDMLLPPNCDDCIEIYYQSFNSEIRILSLSIILRNPTQLTGYDVRGIIYTDDAGHLLIQEDAWTGLWDIPGGEDINPFMALADSEELHAFAPDAEHWAPFLIYIPIPPEFNTITFAVDASWPGNCKEPYAFDNFSLVPLLDTVGASGELKIDVLDWQDDVDAVSLIAPDITGEPSTPLTHLDGNTWTLDLTNNTGAPPGEYDLLFHATSENSGDLPLFCERKITIHAAGSPTNLQDITPPWLNFAPRDVCIDGDYAYVAGDVNGLHIFDFSDPVNPVWVNRVETPGPAIGVDVSNGYAFTLCEYNFLIIDVSDPSTAYIINSFDSLNVAREVTVANGYAYIANGGSGLRIFDIEPVESAHIVNEIETASDAWGLDIAGEYAYIAEGFTGIQIVDINPPESAFVLTTVSLDCYAYDVAVHDGHAYITSTTPPFTIVDIDPPELAHTIHTLDIPLTRHIEIEGNYAYFTGYESGLNIMDISDPASAYIVASVDTPGWAHGFGLGDGFAVVGDQYVGLRIIDITVPESSHTISVVNTPGDARDVDIDNGYAYVANFRGGMQIIDIASPETGEIVAAIDTPGTAYAVAVTEGYAYIADGEEGLQVIDIDPPEMSSIINNVTSATAIVDVVVSGSYAYIMGYGYVGIIDISQPETAYEVNTISTGYSGYIFKIATTDGYVYAGYTGGLMVIDVDPPESASVVQNIQMMAAERIAVSGDYAYALSMIGLHILDISIPESTFEITYVSSDTNPKDIAISSGYAFAVYGDLKYIDVTSPEDLTWHMFERLNTMGSTQGIDVIGNYAYLASTTGGFRIIQLG